MSASVRSLIVAALGLILALYFGSLLGKGSWLLPGALAGGTLLIGLYIIFFRTIRLEAIILGFLLFGYIVGNRGFAQISLTSNTPLYLGELGMVACIALLGFRLALRRESVVPKSKLSYAIVIFVVIGAIRLYGDIFLHLNLQPSAIIIRDAAVVYYSIFFFIAFKVGSDPVGRRLIERYVLTACMFLLPVFVIQFIAFPDLFNRITFRGYPLIAHKGDLTSTYLAFASVYFFLQPARGLGRFLLRSLAALFFLGMFVVTARAAIVGYAGAAFLLLLARRPQLLFVQAVAAAFALVIVGILHLGTSGDQNAVYIKLADKVESITDVSGRHNYRGEVGDYSSDNNQFRMVWWRTVADETFTKGPILGLGFGHDLASRFIQSYYANLHPTFDTRSPHSVWITILGRMGILGLISFTSVAYCILRGAIVTARQVARGKAEPSSLAFWAGAIIILGSASFGVVLEGPMGGILFWSFVGLAASQAKATAKEENSASPTKRQIEGEPALTGVLR